MTGAQRQWKVRAGVVALAALALPMVAASPVDAAPQTPDHTNERVAQVAGASSAKSPPGRFVFTRDRKVLRARNMRTGNITVVHSSAASIDTLALSPDGRRVVWAYYSGEKIKSNRIMLRSTDARKKAENVLRAHPRKFRFIGAMDWSPSGRRLAFLGTKRNGVTSLWSIRSNGSGLRLLRAGVPTCPDNCNRVIWSPDGKQIAWTLDFSWRSLRLASGRVSKLPSGFFGWSRSMKRIGVVAYESGRIVTTTPSGKKRKVVLARDGDDHTYTAYGAGQRIVTALQTPDNDDTNPYVIINAGTGVVSHLQAGNPDMSEAYDWR